MLIETSSTFAAMGAPASRPAPTVAPHGARDGLEVAAHEARTARIERALLALDDLARTRRTHELVEAIERLGAGLGSTMEALDDALGAAVQVHRLALQAPAWEPISEPLVPITAYVAAPEPARALALAPAPAPVAVPAPAAAPVAPAPRAAAPVAPAAPERDRRQAPAGLADFVIDFPELAR